MSILGKHMLLYFFTKYFVPTDLKLDKNLKNCFVLFFLNHIYTAKFNTVDKQTYKV